MPHYTRALYSRSQADTHCKSAAPRSIQAVCSKVYVPLSGHLRLFQSQHTLCRYARSTTVIVLRRLFFFSLRHCIPLNMLSIYVLLSFFGGAVSSYSKAHHGSRRADAPYTNATTTSDGRATGTSRFSPVTVLPSNINGPCDPSRGCSSFSVPPITLPPCLAMYPVSHVGLNYWFSESVEVTVATIISMYASIVVTSCAGTCR